MKSHQFCCKQTTDQKAGVELSCHNNTVELYRSLNHFGFYMYMGRCFSNGGKYAFQLLDVLPNPKPYTYCQQTKITKSSISLTLCLATMPAYVVVQALKLLPMVHMSGS
jgi:hypothetical protein